MIALGCAKNLVDGEVMLGHLRRSGIEVTADPTAAEVVVVNTCGFIVDAKRESIAALLEVAEAKRRGHVRRLVVAGCMAQRYAEELGREIPEIDAFVGLDELDRVVAAVRGGLDGHLPEQRAALRLYDHSEPRLLSTRGYAYLKIAEGCNNPCSFCHIPRMRGRFRSRPPADLVAEARRLESAGVQELILIAQDTTRYGEDLGLRSGLAHLVRELAGSTEVPWFRVLYAYPSTLDEALLELMASEPRLLSYLDLPLQHVNRDVLRLMRRGGDSQRLADLVERVRREVPGIAIRTTFLTGFPGEGEGEFQELVDWVRSVELDHVGVFAYSWQEENPGADLGDPVPPEVKEERRARLLEIQQSISAARNATLVGQRLPALVTGRLEEMELLGEAHLERQAPEIDGRLLVNDGDAPAGTLVEVEITAAHPYDLVGGIVRVLGPSRIATGPAALPTLT
jgi:ribosomal protein S12 methylthiotransferase